MARLVGHIWHSTLNETNFQKSTCTCPEYFKSYVCKHIVGIAAIKKLAIIPPEAKVVRLGQKPKKVVER